MGRFKRLAVLIFVMIGASLGAGLFVAALAAGQPAQAATGIITAGWFPKDIAPEYGIGVDGRPQGFAADFLEAVAQRAGLGVNYVVFATWAEGCAALQAGDIDVIPLMATSPQREQQVLFTRPALISPSSLFVRQESTDIHDARDLAGRRVAVLAAGVSIQSLLERVNTAVPVSHPRLQDMIFALLAGEVDALLSYEGLVWKVSASAGLGGRIKIVGEPLAQARHSIAVRKDRPELRALLDDALAEFLVSPEFRTLHAKWYAGPPSFWTPTRRTWVAGACSVLLMLGLLAWQWLSLRAESRQRAESAPGKLPRERTAAAYPTRVISRNCGLVALALGFAVLWGWAFDAAMFRTMLPGLVAMQPWTAITIALSAPLGFCRFLRQTWDTP